MWASACDACRALTPKPNKSKLVFICAHCRAGRPAACKWVESSPSGSDDDSQSTASDKSYKPDESETEEETEECERSEDAYKAEEGEDE